MLQHPETALNERKFLAWAAAGSMLLAGCTRGHPADDSAVASTQFASAGFAEAAASASAMEASATLDTHTRGWDAGTRYIYDVKLSSAVAFGTGTNSMDFDLTGTVVIVPSTITPETSTLFATIGESAIVSRDPGSQSQFDKVAAQIRSTGCFVTLAGGRITELRVPMSLSPIAANLYRSIVSSLQFARSIETADHYAATEYDTTGRSLVEYTIDATEGVWIKHRVRYLELLGTKKLPSNLPARIVPQVLVSQTRVQLSPDGRPLRVDAHEELALNGAQAPVHSNTTISLASRPSEPLRGLAPDWSALLSETKRVAADEPCSAAPPIEALDDARIRGMDFDHVVARLEEIAKDQRGPAAAGSGVAVQGTDDQAKRQSVEEDFRLFEALAAIFRKQPATVGRAIQKIRSKSPATEVLVDALGSASSSEGQGALIDLINAKTTNLALRNRAVIALSRTSRPDQRSIAAFKAMLSANPFSEEALFGLGSFSRLLRDDGKATQAAQIGDLLIDRLRAASTTPEVIAVLRAIANSGYTPALPQVAPYLSDEREQVRVAGVRALQSMQDATVDNLLASRLVSDAASDVRVSVIDAAKVRDPSDVLARALASAATEALDPRVRYRALELMIRWIPWRPDFRSTLERIAQVDAEERIRKRARAAL
jgi:hypothetical protein